MKNIFLTVALFFALSFAGEGPVSYYGKLKVRAGTAFIDGEKTGKEAQIRGVSFGWSTTDWESERFYTATAVEHMAKDWKAEVVRAAYGATAKASSNSDAVANRTRIETIVNAAIENDVYVIIDWHSHNAHNEVQNSKDFFEYMAQKYGSYDNVIFEIYNEPLCSNGASSCNTGRTTWAEIKTYAEAVIPIIRNYSDNLVLVGTPQWSQKIANVVGNAINDENVGYVLHFYSATHSLNPSPPAVTGFITDMNTTISNGLPIFITEYGTTTSDGGQAPATGTNNYNTHSAAKTDEWHAYMDEKKISSAAWNINDKYEGSSFFGIQGAAKKFDMISWTDLDKMTESGKYIFNKLNEYYLSAPWNPDNIIPDPEPVRISTSLPELGQAAAEVEVYSLSGKKMGKLTELNLKSGVYILISKQGSQIKSMKFAKK